jgi:hypothetical protein
MASKPPSQSLQPIAAHCFFSPGLGDTIETDTADFLNNHRLAFVRIVVGAWESEHILAKFMKDSVVRGCLLQLLYLIARLPTDSSCKVTVKQGCSVQKSVRFC